MQAPAGTNRQEREAAEASPLPRSSPVSVLVPTLNEAADLPSCLANLSFADQICIVDSGSTDDTVTVAGDTRGPAAPPAGD